jgi:hypothetical protein
MLMECGDHDAALQGADVIQQKRRGVAVGGAPGIAGRFMPVYKRGGGFDGSLKYGTVLAEQDFGDAPFQ